MVKQMYADVREELHKAAGRSVLSHLIKLVDDGSSDGRGQQAKTPSTSRADVVADEPEFGQRDTGRGCSISVIRSRVSLTAVASELVHAVDFGDLGDGRLAAAWRGRRSGRRSHWQAPE